MNYHSDIFFIMYPKTPDCNSEQKTKTKAGRQAEVHFWFEFQRPIL